MARHGLLHRHEPATDTAPPELDETTRQVATPGLEPPVTGEVVTQVRPARVSGWATIGLVLGLVGLCATLTGLLAPEGFALGALGVLAALMGMAGAGRPGVTGRGVALLGALFGLVAVLLAVLAMSGQFAWPNSRTNEIAVWHGWLTAHWSWLGRW